MHCPLLKNSQAPSTVAAGFANERACTHAPEAPPMKRQNLPLPKALCLLLFACAGLRPAAGMAETEPGRSAAEAVEGLWRYTTLTPPDGEELDLTGLFLFKDGLFAQQSIFDAEPFENQVAMAHAGTYEAAPNGVHLVAEQTISISPEKEPALSSRGKTEHDLSVSRSGDEMTLVFGSGTVQEFKRVGDGVGRVYPLEHGLLAFVDGYFFLVSGEEDEVTAGYGTFEQHGDTYDVRIVRWSETDGTEISYRKDEVMKATFDGNVLALPDGRSFRISG
jgi:hypothetical protein